MFSGGGQLRRAYVQNPKSTRDSSKKEHDQCNTHSSLGNVLHPDARREKRRISRKIAGGNVSHLCLDIVHQIVDFPARNNVDFDGRWIGHALPHPVDLQASFGSCRRPRSGRQQCHGDNAQCDPTASSVHHDLAEMLERRAQAFPSFPMIAHLRRGPAAATTRDSCPPPSHPTQGNDGYPPVEWRRRREQTFHRGKFSKSLRFQKGRRGDF